MSSVIVEPKARDLTFEFNDSCNCCCWNFRRSPRSSTPVYVNSLGEVSKFDSKKAVDIKTAINRSLSNLQVQLKRIAEDHDLDGEDIIAEVERRSMVDFHQDSKLTLGQVERINSAVKDILT